MCVRGPETEIHYIVHIRVLAVDVSDSLEPRLPFRILSRIFDVSPKLQDKVRNRKPGFKASV